MVSVLFHDLVKRRSSLSISCAFFPEKLSVLVNETCKHLSSPCLSLFILLCVLDGPWLHQPESSQLSVVWRQVCLPQKKQALAVGVLIDLNTCFPCYAWEIPISKRKAPKFVFVKTSFGHSDAQLGLGTNSSHRLIFSTTKCREWLLSTIPSCLCKSVFFHYTTSDKNKGFSILRNFISYLLL